MAITNYYSDVENDVFALWPTSGREDAAYDEWWTQLGLRAKTIIDSYLAKMYSAPFDVVGVSDGPPQLVQEISDGLIIYWGKQFTVGHAVKETGPLMKLYEVTMALLRAVARGKDSKGVPLRLVGISRKTTMLTSNTLGEHTIFSKLPPEEWQQDSDQSERERNERDDD